MAQIQTYPRKTTYDADDLILICDKTPDANGVITNDTKTLTISTIADNLNVVETLNSLKGDINITGGTNVTVTPSGQNIEISTSSSNVDGSGTTGTIPKWSDSNTLTDSIIKDQGGVDVLIPRYIKHDGDTNNLFGFNDVGKFLVSVDVTAEDQFSVAADAIIMKTDSGTKLAAGPGGVSLYNDENGSTTVSKISAGTYDSGLFVRGGTENSFSRGGGVKFYNHANSRYVGISGPATTGTNYEIVLPDAVGTASQVLKLPSTIGTSPYQLEWGDAGSGGGDTYTLGLGLKSGSTIPLNLDAASGSDSAVSLTEGTGVSLTRNSANQITINTTNTLSAGSGVQIGSGTIQTDNLANGGIIYSGASSELAIDLSASAIAGTLAPADGGTGLTNTNPTTHSALMGIGSVAYAESKDVETALKLPTGGTNRRPSASEANSGLIRYNDDTANFEVCKQTTSSSGEYSWYTISGLTIINA